MQTLIKAFDAERPAHPESDYDIGYNNGLVMAQAIAMKYDCSEVPDCKECKYHEPSNIRNRIWCRKMCRYMKEDGFCSEGVKMDA